MLQPVASRYTDYAVPAARLYFINMRPPKAKPKHATGCHVDINDNVSLKNFVLQESELLVH